MTTHVGVVVRTSDDKVLKKTFYVDDFSEIFAKFKDERDFLRRFRTTREGRPWDWIDGYTVIDFKGKLMTTFKNALWWDWQEVIDKMTVMKERGWKIILQYSP